MLVSSAPGKTGFSQVLKQATGSFAAAGAGFTAVLDYFLK